MCNGIDTGYDPDEVLCKMIEEEAIKESQERAIESKKVVITSTQKQNIDLSQV